MVIEPGLNAKFAIDTFTPSPAAAVRLAPCTTSLRGPCPTAITVTLPLSRSTTDMSLDPSLVTYAILPSPESASQCGCLPTAMLRTSLLVSGSNSISCPGPCTTTTPNLVPPNRSTKCGDTPVGISATILSEVGSSTWTAATPASVK